MPATKLWVQCRGLLEPFWLAGWRCRSLVWQLTLREIRGRYRGSFLGLVWAFLTPLLMLAVYTFVFGVVLKARWPGLQGEGSLAEFALVMFAGQIVFQVFSESVARAPHLVVAVPNYVKKVVFPLEVLTLPVMASALFHFLVAILILAVFSWGLHGSLPWTALALPAAVLPVVLMGLGVSWFLASLGVFVRDIGQGIGIALQVLLLMTPIFYPLSAVPPAFQRVLALNPLCEPVEAVRRLVIWGTWPDWTRLGTTLLLALLVAQLGYAWFSKTKRGFADVL